MGHPEELRQEFLLLLYGHGIRILGFLGVHMDCQPMEHKQDSLTTSPVIVEAAVSFQCLSRKSLSVLEPN